MGVGTRTRRSSPVRGRDRPRPSASSGGGTCLLRTASPASTADGRRPRTSSPRPRRRSSRCCRSAAALTSTSGPTSSRRCARSRPTTRGASCGSRPWPATTSSCSSNRPSLPMVGTTPTVPALPAAGSPTSSTPRSCARPSPACPSATSRCCGTRRSRGRRRACVAPMLGMTAGAVSSGRCGPASRCARVTSTRMPSGASRTPSHVSARWTIERLGRLVRGRLPRRQTERAEAHVASCPHAAAVAADLREIHRGFPALVVPLVLAAGFGSTGLAAALGFAGAGWPAPVRRRSPRWARCPWVRVWRRLLRRA